MIEYWVLKGREYRGYFGWIFNVQPEFAQIFHLTQNAIIVVYGKKCQVFSSDG
jgi:hypothetical protein